MSSVVINALLHLGVLAIEKGAIVSPSIKVATFTYLLFKYIKMDSALDNLQRLTCHKIKPIKYK